MKQYKGIHIRFYWYSSKIYVHTYDSYIACLLYWEAWGHFSIVQYLKGIHTSCTSVNYFYRKFLYFPSGRDTFLYYCPVSSPVTFLTYWDRESLMDIWWSEDKNKKPRRTNTSIIHHSPKNTSILRRASERQASSEEWVEDKPRNH